MTSPEILIRLIVALVAFAAGAFVFLQIGRRQGRAESEPGMVGMQRDLAARAERIEVLERDARTLEAELAKLRMRAEQAIYGGYKAVSAVEIRAMPGYGSCSASDTILEKF